MDTELPSGGGWYDNLTSDMGTQTLWVALAEKAYVEANALGYVTTGAGGMDSYNALDGGDPAWALEAITGKPASDLSITFLTEPSFLSAEIAAAWNAGHLIALCTSSPSSSSIVSDHCYAVVGYNAANGGTFEMFNPWGSNSLGWAAPPGKTSKILGQFWANAGFIELNFDQQSIGTGAMSGDAFDRAIDELTELSALGGDSDPMGMIHSTRHRLTGSVVVRRRPSALPGRSQGMQAVRTVETPGRESGTRLVFWIHGRERGRAGRSDALRSDDTCDRPTRANRVLDASVESDRCARGPRSLLRHGVPVCRPPWVRGTRWRTWRPRHPLTGGGIPLGYRRGRAFR